MPPQARLDSKQDNQRAEEEQKLIKAERLEAAGRTLTVCLPPSYGTEQLRRYPVAYVQDGGELVSHTYNELQHLFAQGRIQEIICVGVSSHNRNDEYTPWPAASLLAGNPPFGGGARSYVDELADQCKPVIDARYRTQTGPEHTAIIGGSFGGLVSMFAGLWRPEVFGRLGLLSASCWYEGVLDYLSDAGADAGTGAGAGAFPSPRQRIYMSVGDCEGIYKQNRQRSMVEASLAVRRLLQERQIGEEGFRFQMDAGGTHDAHYMASNFPRALQWLFLGGEADREAVAERGREADREADREAVAERGREADREPIAERGNEAHVGGTAHQRVPGQPIRHEAAALRLPSEAGRMGSAGGYEIPRTEQWAIRAAGSGRQYRILLSLPPEPPPAKGHPVLYTLDANATFGSLAEAMRLQGRKPHGIEPQVIVGIAYDSEGPMVTRERFIDYTDPAMPHELPRRPDGTDWPETGGAEAFADFIEHELKPAIERHIPIDRARQSLFGHSLGGYFTLRTLLRNPESFQAYIAGSPSIWWKNHALYEWVPQFAERVARGEAGKAALLIGVEADGSKMPRDAEELCRRLAPCTGPHYEQRLRLYEGEGHVTMIYPFISELLRFINGATKTNCGALTNF